MIFDYSELSTIAEFYDGFFERALTGFRNIPLIESLPDLVINLAWEWWKAKPSQTKMLSGLTVQEYNDTIFAWGINRRFCYYPVAINSTPVYYLLSSYPYKGLSLVIGFINYTLEYNGNERYYKTVCILNDGQKRTLYGSAEVWGMYVGLSPQNQLLQSILLGLEAFLLDLAMEEDACLLESVIKYIYENTNNIAPFGVIASIGMAYPWIVGEGMMPLLRTEEFYEFDAERAKFEMMVETEPEDKFSLAGKDQDRRKYRNGLIDFTLNYRLCFGDNIFKNLNDLKDTITVRDKNIVSDIKNEDNNFRPDLYEGNKMAYYLYISNNIQSGYKDSEQIDIFQWRVYYQIYLRKDRWNDVDSSIVLSVIGIRDFLCQLDSDEIIWCVNNILDIVRKINQDYYYVRLERNQIQDSIQERATAWDNYHLLFSLSNDYVNKQEWMSILVNAIVSFPLYFEARRFFSRLRTMFFNSEHQIAEKLLFVLIRVAEYRKKYPGVTDIKNTNRAIDKEKELAFIEELISRDQLFVDVDKVDFIDYDLQVILKTLYILPFCEEKNLIQRYVKRFFYLLLLDVNYVEDEMRNVANKKRMVALSELPEIELYLSLVFLNSSSDFSMSILDIIKDACYSKAQKGIYSILRHVLHNMIQNLDQLLRDEVDPDVKERVITRFWNVWKYIFVWVKDKPNIYLETYLLLGLKWEDDRNDWASWKNNQDFYWKMMEEFKFKRLHSILEVLSTIGEKSFLPDAISWLVETLKQKKDDHALLVSTAGERLIKRLYYNHITTIKGNKRLVNDYIWILNTMVDLGSSEAYRYRENVIVYKQLD
jgi:hypothetical protein